MAIKDRWNRMLRKSVSSGSSVGNDGAEPNPIPAPATGTSPASAGSAELTKAPSRLAKTLTWRSNKSPSEPPQKKKKAATPSKPLHPSQRPLTETNLKHQEMLGAFTMKFGRRRMSQGGRTSYSNISPGGSRHASLDMGHHGHGHGDRRVSALVHEVPPDVAEEGSQQTT